MKNRIIVEYVKYITFYFIYIRCRKVSFVVVDDAFCQLQSTKILIVNSRIFNNYINHYSLTLMLLQLWLIIYKYFLQWPTNHFFCSLSGVLMHKTDTPSGSNSAATTILSKNSHNTRCQQYNLNNNIVKRKHLTC